MRNIFLVFGYGVPEDILKDEIYNFYLKIVFNKIYSEIVKNKIKKPIIITCGGPTDMIEPFKRTEADEMIRFFKDYIKSKDFIKSIAQDWTFISENTSLSTLENILHSQKIIRKRKITNANIYIFCEQTRARRIWMIARKIFNNNYSLKVVPIDFDVSENRYLSKEYLDKKEKAELKHSFWAMKSSENLKKHHEVFEEKFEYFRKMRDKKDINAIKKWWDKKLKELEK